MKCKNFYSLSFTCLLAVVLAACVATPAPPPPPATLPVTAPQPIAAIDLPPATAGGAFFALSVADAEASAKWYAEKLDLKVVMRPPKANQATVIVLEGNGLIVELIQHDSAQPLSKLAPEIKNNILVHGLIKAGLVVEDFDQTVALLRARQVSIVIGPFPAKADQRANMIITDNEGNLIQFFGK